MLLMFAPLRGVVAGHCDMQVTGDMAAMSDTMHASMGHDMSAMHSTDAMPADTSKHYCCDDASAKCSGVCDLGINISLMQPQTSYSPVYNSSFKSAVFTSKILFRELAPPSRPPATLHS